MGHLATVTATQQAHLVPCCFVLDADTLYSAIDAKPKSTFALRRLQNITSNGAASLLVDHYEDDWDSLWWVRADGQAAILDDPVTMAPALTLLAGRYPQYREHPPCGPVISIHVDRWTGWTARLS